jgi:endoglucanase
MKKLSTAKALICVIMLAIPSVLGAQTLGDANNSGTIDIVDALIIAQYYVGLNPQNFYASAADVNADGSITIVDALLVAQYYVGLITSFPAGTAAPNATPTTAPNGTPTATPTTPPGGPAGSVSWLHTDGKYIKDASGNVPPLYGVSFPCITTIVDSRTIPGDASKTNIQRYIDKATNTADGWRSNVVRFPVYPDWFNDETGSHQGWKQLDPDTYFSTYLDPAIRYCIEKKVYVIIDWHYIGQSWTDPTIVSNTNAFWTYLPPKYANCSNVLFEIFNEPTGGITQTDWNSWKTAADAWVSMIRKAAPNNLILVGSPSFSQDLTYVPQNPISGTNIVYIAHIYPGHAQSNWDSWFGNTADSYPVMITEWGYEAGATNPCDGTQTSYGNAFKAYINGKDNIRWTGWCFDYIWHPVMWDSNWNLLSGYNYMGQFVKTWISEKL